MNYNSNSYRIKAEKGAKKDGEIFDAKKEEYKPSEQRKTDQGAVDTQVNFQLNILFYNHPILLTRVEKPLFLNLISFRILVPFKIWLYNSSYFQVLAAIKKHSEGAALKQYLKASFALSKGQFPHQMAF